MKVEVVIQLIIGAIILIATLVRKASKKLSDESTARSKETATNLPPQQIRPRRHRSLFDISDYLDGRSSDGEASDATSAANAYDNENDEDDEDIEVAYELTAEEMSDEPTKEEDNFEIAEVSNSNDESSETIHTNIHADAYLIKKNKKSEKKNSLATIMNRYNTAELAIILPAIIDKYQDQQDRF